MPMNGSDKTPQASRSSKYWVPGLASDLRFYTLLGAAIYLAGCSSGHTSSSSNPVTPPPTVTTNPAVAATNVYVSDAGDTSVNVYTADLVGEVKATSTYGNPGKQAVTAVTGDSAGNLYMGVVDTTTAGAIRVFTPGSFTPTRSISLPDPGAGNNNTPTAMTTDSSGNLYVATYFSTIYVYGAGASGPATPLRRLAGSLTTLPTSYVVTQMAVDSAGDLYVAEGDGHPGSQVVMFAPGATGNVAPGIVTSSAYGPSGVTLDNSDVIYISQGSYGTSFGNPAIKYVSAIYVFAKGAVAGAKPTRTILGDTTEMTGSLHNIAVDTGGNIFVMENTDVLPGMPAMLVFGAGASGNVAPASILFLDHGSTADSQFYLK